MTNDQTEQVVRVGDQVAIDPVTGDGTTWILTIGERGQHDPSSDVYEVGTVIPDRLIGKKIGDKVELPTREENVFTGEIAQIMH